MKQWMVTTDHVNEVKEALDLLGLALTNYNHTWTQKQHEYYENAINILLKLEKQLIETEKLQQNSF